MYELLNFSVATSHSFTLLSSLEDNMRLASGLKLTDRTAAVWPLMVLVFVEVPGCQSLINVSCEPLTMTLSMGEKLIALHFLIWPSRSRFLLELATLKREMLF
jgi:hypothetical protein